jgi:hypothetical protein
MARGWESKAVEAQQADAATLTPVGRRISADEAARRAHLTTLTLARRRTEADLRSAVASAHRSMLERAIEDLDRKIAALR